MATKEFHWGVGRRKTSVARVRIMEGNGQFLINDRSIEDFFTEDKDRALIVAPLQLADLRQRVNVFVNVRGGGITGQAGAICQGVARAMKEMFGLANEPDEPPQPATAAAPTIEGMPAGPPQPAEAQPMSLARRLRVSGYLTRDARRKERKHYGRKGARRGFQFSKR